ncbi:MAG: TolC family protein [Planctomycetota bacterium]
MPPEPGLSDYLGYAALNNPGLRATFELWKAELEKVPQAKALPDPMFTYAYYIQEVETRVGPQRNSLKLTQTFPWFGKLELRGDTAAEAAEAARQQYEARKLKLFYEVKDAYYEYYYLGQATAVARENVRLLEHLESVVRARYKAAAAGHPDLIRLQVELGKLRDRLRSLRDMKTPIVARLAAALNLPEETDLPWPKEIEPATTTATESQMLTWAVESNPLLKSLDARISRNKKQVELAKKEYFPDVTLGLTWIDTRDRVGTPRPTDSGNDALIAMVSVDLPIWREKIRAGVLEARLRYLSAVNQKADETNSLVATIKLAAYRYRDAQGKISLYRRVLIPKATESLEVNSAAFRAGKVGFSDLIDAQRVLLEFRLTYERALADRARHLAKLEMLIGRPVPRD